MSGSDFYFDLFLFPILFLIDTATSTLALDIKSVKVSIASVELLSPVLTLFEIFEVSVVVVLFSLSLASSFGFSVSGLSGSGLSSSPVRVYLFSTIGLLFSILTSNLPSLFSEITTFIIFSELSYVQFLGALLTSLTTTI